MAQASHELDPVQARSPWLCRFFGRIMRRQMRRNFHALRIAKPGAPRLPAGRPVVVYTNHPSWWDPALFMVLATTFFSGRPGYGPIEAAALEKYRFMRRIGVFGIEPETRRGAATFLRTSLRLLEDPSAMLWVTAQGRFADPRLRPLRLKPGVAHLMARAPHAIALPLALEYPFWDERWPEALCRFGDPLPGDRADHRSADAWQDRLEAALTATLDALAADAMSRDPGRFETLLRGSVGVGGIYDLWRQARARWQGERFHPEHGRPEA